MTDAAEIQTRLDELRCKTCWHLPTDDEGCTGCRMVLPAAARHLVLPDEAMNAVLGAMISPLDLTATARSSFARPK